MSLVRRSLLVAMVLVLFTASSSAGAHPSIIYDRNGNALIANGGAKPSAGTAAGCSLCDLDRVSCPPLQRWLERAYSESAVHAAFGDYPGENLDVPSLQQTWAALRILQNDVPAQPTPSLSAASEWIASLQLPNGLYNDPITSAPVLLETYWAVDILRTIDALPQSPSETRTSLLDALPPADHLQVAAPSRDLLNALGDVMLILRALEALEGRVSLEQDPALSTLREATKSILATCRPPDTARYGWGEDDKRAMAAATCAAWLFGAGAPAMTRTILETQLTAAPDYPAGFLGESEVAQLLRAQELALGWTGTPPETAAALAAYLDETEPTESDWQGYGFGDGEWPWVDPSLNVYRTQLYAMAGRRNPVMASILHVVDGLRCLEGWSTLIHAIPGMDFTYFGVRVALASGATFVNYDKVAVYAREALTAPETDPETLLWCARVLLAVNLFGDEDRAVVTSRVSGMSETGLEENLEAVIVLLDETGILPSVPVRSLLQQRASDLAQTIPTLHPSRLLQVARLSSLLEESAGAASDAVAEAIEALAVSSGGYRTSRALPMADLMATYYAVETLGALDRLADADVVGLRAFVLACWVSYGFQMLRPEDNAPEYGVSAPDLLTTYLGVDILCRLAALPASP